MYRIIIIWYRLWGMMRKVSFSWNLNKFTINLNKLASCVAVWSTETTFIFCRFVLFVTLTQILIWPASTLLRSWLRFLIVPSSWWLLVIRSGSPALPLFLWMILWSYPSSRRLLGTTIWNFNLLLGIQRYFWDTRILLLLIICRNYLLIIFLFFLCLFFLVHLLSHTPPLRVLLFILHSLWICNLLRVFLLIP